MFKISGTKILITRGDKGVIKFEIENYKFKKDDIIDFKIYKAKQLTQSPIKSKKIIVTTEKDFIEIELSSEDTSIGVSINKPVEYWYEIVLNSNQTILGYDDAGAKTITIYPEGADD